mmetsp:Transcript_9265/g.20732  ORF Transcript_9265/g.20732 Transcript_9265/m.20732 type:complete len:273 (+) Transcript_9265:984-1802(+)
MRLHGLRCTLHHYRHWCRVDSWSRRRRRACHAIHHDGSGKILDHLRLLLPPHGIERLCDDLSRQWRLLLNLSSPSNEEISLDLLVLGLVEVRAQLDLETGDCHLWSLLLRRLGCVLGGCLGSISFAQFDHRVTRGFRLHRNHSTPYVAMLLHLAVCTLVLQRNLAWILGRTRSLAGLLLLQDVCLDLLNGFGTSGHVCIGILAARSTITGSPRLASFGHAFSALATASFSSAVQQVPDGILHVLQLFTFLAALATFAAIFATILPSFLASGI